MSFAFRYSLPKEMDYQLHIGSGPIDPQTGYPPSQIDKVITQDESQKTLIVNLEKMPTEKGNRWTMQCIDGLELSRMICNDEFEFTWLQAYLAAFQLTIRWVVVSTFDPFALPEFRDMAK